MAAAIVEGAKARGLVLGAAPEHVTAIAGRGLEAAVEGHAVLIGTRRLLSERSIAYDTLEEQLIALEQQGKTVMIVVIDGKVAGLVAVADTVKVGSEEAIKQLHAQGLAVWMITGDNKRAAAGYCSAGWHAQPNTCWQRFCLKIKPTRSNVCRSRVWSWLSRATVSMMLLH